MSRFTIDWSELSFQVMITFGHFLWQACIVAVVLVIVEQLSSVVFGFASRGREQDFGYHPSSDLSPHGSHRSANFRYTIACSAFFTLPICVVATFALVHQSRGSVFQSASDPILSLVIPAVIANESNPPTASNESAIKTQVDLPLETQLPSSVRMPVVPPTTEPVLAESPTRIDQIQSFAPYLFFAYAIGVFLLLARFGLSIVGSSRLRSKLQPIADSNLLKCIAAQSSRLSLRRVPIVALCQRVSVPVVVGIVKPMILLPPALLCGLDPNQLAAILSHELAHIRRYDLIVNLLQRIVEALLFFHPVAWWISRRIRLERENCCDDMAAAGCGRIEYAAALLRMAEQCAAIRGLKIAPQLESLAADGGSTSQLGYRIQRLLGENHTPRVCLTRSSVATIALAAVFGGLSMIAVAQSGSDAPADKTPAKPEAGLQIRKAHVVMDSNVGDDTRINAMKTWPWKFGDGKTKSIQIDMKQPPLISESDILGVEACGPLMLQLTQAARERIVKATVQTTEPGSPSRLLAILLHGELVGVDEIHNPIKDDQRIAIHYRGSPDAITRLREYVTPSLVNYHCQGVPVTAPDNSFSIASKLFAVESSPGGQRQLFVQYRFTEPRDESIRVEYTLDGKTEARTLKRGESIDVPLINDPVAGRYKAIPTIVADGDHFNIESTVTRSLDGVAIQEEFKTPVVALRLLPETDDGDNKKQSGRAKTNSRKRSFKLVDGETGNPLQEIDCKVCLWKLNTPLRFQSGTTDELGMLHMDFAEGESPWIYEVDGGWFSSDALTVMEFAEPDSEQQPQANLEKQVEEPIVIKLWRGTEVDGRLLWPDKTPAAGVKLNTGVYITDQNLKAKLEIDLMIESFDHGDWPNWSRTIVTDDAGRFHVTVPPKGSRWWLRVGTTTLGFGPQTGLGKDEAVTQRLAQCVPLELQYGGDNRGNVPIVPDNSAAADIVLHAGDLQLKTGVIVRGRVVDVEGNGLSNVHLTTTGPHGPHSGRSAVSGEDGKFEFPAMAAGSLTVHPDARLRDDKGQVKSRDVQAVFVDQSFRISEIFMPHEITIHAVPHTEVDFKWVDRRADMAQPVAYYGAFRVLGYMPVDEGKPSTYWTSETERVERDGKQWLTVKMPTQLLKPELMLVADRNVTASYSDSTGLTSGPGIVQLGDITANTTRTIFGDEPRESAESRGSQQPASNDQSSWIPSRPLKVTVASAGTAKILDDHSVRLEGDVPWQEASLQFAFDKPTSVEEVRLEILPVDSPAGPRFGRGGSQLMLFDVKPSIEDQDGKFTSLEFANCNYLQNQSDETAANCIDYLSDTGWKVPPLPADETAHELVLRFEKPITLRADQRLTLTVDSGSAKELAVLNRIRFAFRQGAVAEPLSVNSTMNGSDVGELITTGGANEKVEPWEISKLYEAAFLRTYLQDHETLPKPIVVPPVSGKVFDPDGNPASGVRIVSHTPRHWVDLDATLALKPHNSGGVRNSKQDGTFGLPERTEPYRVLLVHDSGVANVSHEELLRANGIVTLQKWASVSGTLKLGGKPQAGETIVLHFDTLPWSYSRGGPRLTTTHKATTDRDGNFSFDRVPPLGGMARSLRGHGAVYQCESGKNTHIDIGAGITVTGKLSLPENLQKNKLTVYARNHLLPIPYPKDWTDNVTKEERNAWRIKWSSTAEGCKLEDRNFVLMNSNVPGAISDDGQFTIYGVPERPMVLVVVIPGETILLEKPFECTGSANDALDLGTLTLSDNHDHHHDHHHDDVKQEGQPADKPQLPRLIVRTVDSDGKPVPDTGVLFYDRNSHRAGQKQEFEKVDRRTDESGVADFGVIPNSFGCLQLSPSNKELAECYTLISTTMTKCTQAKPPRANVRTEIRDGILTVTFTMTPHVDLEFNIVDDATDEIVFWSEIFYQDPTTDRWWQFGLVDGSKTQHNFIPISPQITHEKIRISALGYETKVFRLPDELDRSKPIRRDVRLKPMPDVELKVLLHDGTPAEKAKLTFHFPNELDCLQIHEQLADSQGIVTTKFPPSADIGIFRLEHTGGTAELSMKELLDAVKQNPGEVIHRSISLRE